MPTADSSVMFLALLLKELGGQYVIQKDTFMGFPDEFEIVVSRTALENVMVSLIEDEAQVKKIRDDRRAEALKPKIIIP